MKCPECQIELPNGSKFCGQCGTKLTMVCPNCMARFIAGISWGTGGRVPNYLLVACIALAIVVGTCNWGLHEDLYMSLCAGRDALALKLGEPDYWSLLTGSKVWINQGWASHLILYVSLLGLDNWGPILVALSLFAACTVVVLATGLRAGLSSTPVFLATALSTASLTAHLSIRAENFAMLYYTLLSALLLVRDLPRSVVYCGTIAVVLIWSNSHGTFVLALPMMFIAALCNILSRYIEGLEFSKASPYCKGRFGSGCREPSESPRNCARKPGTWLALAVLSICVFGIANPYGSANLAMPFQQVSVDDWHQTVAFWKPLVSYSNGLAVYDGTDSAPFILFELGTLALLVLLFIRLGFKRVLLNSSSGGRFPDGAWVMTALGLWALMICVTLKFGRALLFCSLATVPVAAYLLDLLFKTQASVTRDVISNPSKGYRHAVTIFSLVLLLGLGVVLLNRTVIPLLPNNPVIDSPNISGRILGPLAIYTPSLTNFLRDNGISGKTFSTWALSDVLVFRVPDMKIFVDCRAQSIYSSKQLRDYGVITRATLQDPGSAHLATRLLDDYYIENVVLANNGYENPQNLVEILLQSDQWTPIYVNPYRRGFVFVRKRSRWQRIVESPELSRTLRYPDPDTAAVSRAYALVANGEKLDSESVDQLKKIARERPARCIYKALAMASIMSDGCLSDETRSYLVQELSRIARLRLVRPQINYSVLLSQLEITYILNGEDLTCSGNLRRLVPAADRAIRFAIEELKGFYVPGNASHWPWP